MKADMITDDGSSEMNDGIKEQLIITKWYSDDMNRFRQKPRNVALVEAKYVVRKFRDEE
jgi:hypothetical protein|tara:strand:+ start:695 stop:871 length:177 start_codon:yes stop_codon:yes gene_type:complete